MKKFLTLFFSLLLVVGYNTANAQLRIVAVDPGNSLVTIHNYGSSTVNISSYWLCNFPSYQQFSGMTVLGGSTTLAAGENVLVQWTSITGTNGEVGLYNSASFSSSAAMEDYYEWGSAGHQRESVAVSAGVWIAGNFVPGTGPHYFVGGPNDHGSAFWSSTPPVPDAAFSSAVNGLTVDFTDTTDTWVILTDWLWSFGDGNTSTAQNPTNTYATAGTYTVCLTVTDTLGSSDSSCASVTVTAPCVAPTATWTNTATGLTASFTNTTSVTGPAMYSWNFGDGNLSAMENPVHSYMMSGTYTVCLIVTDSCGADTTCNSVTVSGGGCVDPTASWGSADSLLTVAFTDMSSITGMATYSWNFGDGNTSTMQNPIHTYAMSGTYTACLIVSDSCGADTSCMPVMVSGGGCPGPMASFNYTSNLYTASFNNGSSVTGTATYLWDFGDGNTSTMENPMHTYDSVGSYTACLVVTDSCGLDSMCLVVAITCPGPTAGFNVTQTVPDAGIYDYADSSFTSNTILSYSWDMGDGTTYMDSTDFSHTFAANGSYVVCLTVTDSCGSSTYCDTTVVILNSVGDINALGSNVTLFPNPTDEALNIVLTGQTGMVQFAIFDATGRLVLQRNEVAGTHRFDVSDLSEGVYLLKVQSETEQTVKRVVVR